MYHVSAEGVDQRMINVHYDYYYWKVTHKVKVTHLEGDPQSEGNSLGR